MSGWLWFSVGMYYTVAATHNVGVFGWGLAEGLGLPQATTDVIDFDDAPRVCVLSPHRYPQLACVPRS